jgi:metal-responsive CopG/Arc/MetJ family transcriptional regulator
MKTAISLPDGLFKAGEAIAERLGISRSRLYAIALEEYITRHQTRKVSERLDAVYSTEPSTIDPGIAAAQARGIALGVINLIGPADGEPEVW